MKKISIENNDSPSFFSCFLSPFFTQFLEQRVSESLSGILRVQVDWPQPHFSVSLDLGPRICMSHRFPSSSEAGMRLVLNKAGDQGHAWAEKPDRAE